MNTSDEVYITLRLSRIDRDNFKCKVKNGKYKKMQYILEYWIKQYLYGDENVKKDKSYEELSKEDLESIIKVSKPN